MEDGGGPQRVHSGMNVISVVCGLGALLGALVGFIPLLGWFNWLILPLAFTGLIFGLLAESNSGRNVNIVVLTAAIIRLSLGGGIL